jgi:Zn-dependent M28 family amino/carboxypeptidase
VNLKKQEKTLLWINLTSIADFKSITSKLIHPAGMPMSDILIVGSSSAPVAMNLKIKEDDVPDDLFNIVGIIPGDSLPHEAVVFSAHYDHVDEDYSDPSKKGQVFNGANDNASGTTAVLALAKYFAELKDNRRTLVFCLFAAEEIGLLGSEAFVRMINIKNIKANINIEMIGNTNATGPNAFMVTGYDKSTLYNILNKNMKGDRFQVKPLVNDPKMLFERSDNYSFARYNIPAHSIMCSDDSDPCYHKPCDDFKFIRVENMTKVIRAIAKSSSTIISGEDTPVWKNK